MARKMKLSSAQHETSVKLVLTTLKSLFPCYQHSYISVDIEKVAELLLGPLYALSSYPGQALDLSRGRGGSVQAVLAHTELTHVTVLHAMEYHTTSGQLD